MEMQQNKDGGGCAPEDAGTISARQWWVFVLCFLIMFLDGLDTVLIGFMAPYIGAAWQLPKGALTPAFTAGVAGLMLAGCVAGILADRVGRRPLLLAAVGLFGLGNLATAYCNSLEALVALRFLTGLGLGAAMPCAVALVAEYAPARRRALIITSMYCGYTLGGAFVGWLTPLIVTQHGWRAMFIVGAALPLALLHVLPWRLPESPAFLAGRRGAPGAVRESAAGNPLAMIVAPAYRRQTGLLWLANGCGLMITFTLINWLPSFLTFKHVSAQSAALAGASLQVGGAVGALLVGWLMDRFGGGRVAVATYLGAAALAPLWLPALDGGNTALLLMGLLAGMLVMGGQTGFQVLATAVYPVAARATGLSWMQSVGRLGGIVGIQLAGLGIARGIDAATLLQALCVPALLAAAAAAALYLRIKPSQAQPAPATEASRGAA